MNTAVEKAHQEETSHKNEEDVKKQSLALKVLKEENESFMRTVITENFDKLLMESEEIKEKNKEIEE
eukprot:10539620-Ditylum_brightwellii.AAC.1